MKTDEIRDMTSDDITARVGQLQEELFRLRFRRATVELDNPILLRTLRKDIARLKTVLRERELSSEGAR
ncbi:MAG: 50S ribosomal protein L29 [Gemmatimonadota bacterium]|jgi:large subunit ribosomal protein L29|nr:50S ribosomal protein L29 [Gemmatimonadota bacterium]